MPRKKYYVCLRCEKKFDVDIWDTEEARKENINLVHVKCPNPNCKSTDVIDSEEIS